jgi:hypothetical protein
MLALDARIVLHLPGTREEDLPRLAIRPYALGYITPWSCGTEPPSRFDRFVPKTSR